MWSWSPARRLALRVRPRDRRADLADRGASGPEDRHARRTELADTAVSDQPATVCEAIVRRRRHQPLSACRRSRRLQEAAARRHQQGPLHANQFHRHGAHADAATAASLFGGMAAEPRTGAVYVVAHDNPGSSVCSGRARTPGAAVAPPCRRDKSSTSRTARRATAPIDWARMTACRWSTATADPANNIAAGAPRFDAAAIRAVLGAGKGRMPAFPHLTATDVDTLVDVPDDGCRPRRGQGGAGWPRRGARSADPAHRPS